MALLSIQFLWSSQLNWFLLWLHGAPCSHLTSIVSRELFIPLGVNSSLLTFLWSSLYFRLSSFCCHPWSPGDLISSRSWVLRWQIFLIGTCLSYPLRSWSGMLLWARHHMLAPLCLPTFSLIACPCTSFCLSFRISSWVLTPLFSLRRWKMPWLTLNGAKLWVRIWALTKDQTWDFVPLHMKSLFWVVLGYILWK